MRYGDIQTDGQAYRRHGTYVELYGHCDRQTDRQTKQQAWYITVNNAVIVTDTQTDRQTDRQTERQTDRRTAIKSLQCIQKIIWK